MSFGPSTSATKDLFEVFIPMGTHTGKQISNVFSPDPTVRAMLLVWGSGEFILPREKSIELGIEVYNNTAGEWVKLVQSLSAEGTFIHGLLVGGSGITTPSRFVQEVNDMPLTAEFRVYVQPDPETGLVEYQVVGLQF